MSSVSFSQLGKMGRLGNQLWQISGLMAYAAKYNVKVIFPEWEYQKYFKYTFNCQSSINVDRTYNEPTFHYTPIPYLSYDFDYSGYLQSPKHWEGIIVPYKLFELKSEYQKQVDDLYQKINPKNVRVASLHIRRGDYLIPPHDAYHGVLPLSYYSNAISYLYGEKYNDILFLVFSDDIEYCKKHISLPNMYFSEGNNEIEDLFLMAKCDDNIIANSSFSYWGALLNKNVNKRVVMPKKWFAGANLNTQDLYLPNAIIL